MKLFIDDIREAPEGWAHAKTVSEAIRFLAQFGNEVDEISIDHDISHGDESCPETFAAVCYFIGERFKHLADPLSEQAPPKIILHTGSIVGAEDMEHILGRYGLKCEIKLPI